MEGDVNRGLCSLGPDLCDRWQDIGEARCREHKNLPSGLLPARLAHGHSARGAHGPRDTLSRDHPWRPDRRDQKEKHRRHNWLHRNRTVSSGRPAEATRWGKFWEHGPAGYDQLPVAGNGVPAIFRDMRDSLWTPPGDGIPTVTTAIEVRTSELDSFGHVNHAVHLSYFEHARFQALNAAGFSWDVLDEHGWAIYVVRIEVDYLVEVGREDRLLIRTWADSFRRTSMVLHQHMAMEDEPDRTVAQARVTAVWIGPDRKPMRVPADVREGLTRTPA